MDSLAEPSLAEPSPVKVAGKPLVGRVVFSVLVLTAAFLGTTAGLLIVYSTDLPQISELERYRPSTLTELYDDQGRQIGSFALQRRVLATYDDFPKVLRDAILSTEDKTFETHWGINFWRVFGATYRDVTSSSRATCFFRLIAISAARCRKRCLLCRLSAASPNSRSSRCIATRFFWGM